MTKAKSKAIVLTPDGTGGMAQVQDRRFEQHDWPIRFTLPVEQAETWLLYFSAECTKRGWGFSSMGQLDAKENSGSITVTTGGAGQPQVAVVWERKRGGPLKVQARSGVTPEFPLDKAKELFRQVSERCRAGVTEQYYRGGLLCYEGLAWRGELWLDETLRLGPPSQQDETASIGPRIILVSALVNGISPQHAASTINVFLQELSVFLTVVMGTNVRVSSNASRAWTWSTDPSPQAVRSEIRYLGYCETQWPDKLPTQGQNQPVPLRAIHRPDFSLRGIGSQTEIHLPGDIVDLWKAFAGLTADRRRQFLQVGSMWQLALSLGHEYQTARFAWMVAACEVLKPPELEYRDHNIYQVVEALLGKPNADLLQERWFRPQEVRNAHLHRGEFRGSEFVHNVMLSSFQDPTFTQASRGLYQIAQAAIIEWLRRGGTYTMPPVKRHTSRRRRVKGRTVILWSLFLGVGVVLGWLLSILWTGR